MNYGLIRLRTRSIHRIAALQSLVGSLDETYASLSAIDDAIALMVGDRQDFDPSVVYGNGRGTEYMPRTLAEAAEFVDGHRKQVRRFIEGSPLLSQEGEPYNRLLKNEGRLIVHSFQMNSPGVWEFIGSLNPLEVIRNALNDRHKRRQDLQYREAEEANRLAHENRRLELENIEIEDRIAFRRIDELSAAGVSKRELKNLARRLASRPMARLEEVSDILDVDASHPIEEVRSHDPRSAR